MPEIQSTYLGDGAYASFDGFAVSVFTDNGETVTNNVYLEPEGIKALLRFFKNQGFSLE